MHWTVSSGLTLVDVTQTAEIHQTDRGQESPYSSGRKSSWLAGWLVGELSPVNHRGLH